MTQPASNLKDMVAYQVDSIVSKEIIKKQTGTVTIFAFDQDQGLSEHTAPFEALAHVLLQRRLPALERLDIGGNALGAEGAATLERLQRALLWPRRRRVVHAYNNGFDKPTKAALHALGCNL